MISAKARLALTLRYLATGETYRSLSFQFRISRAIPYIVSQVCKAITSQLGEIYLRVPATQEEWLAIAQKFEECNPPANSGSVYYNYKHTHAIVLLAIVVPEYECLYADVGTNGRVSDGGIWNKCSFSEKLNDGELSIPAPKPLHQLTYDSVPYVIVADHAFALRPNLMKPYPQTGLTEDRRIYNYRHSRARRISENLFGITANRWRVLRSVILLPPKTIEHLVFAILTLHNFLCKSSSKKIVQHFFSDE